MVGDQVGPLEAPAGTPTWWAAVIGGEAVVPFALEVDLVQAAVPSAVAVSVTLVLDAVPPSTAAATSDVARRLDELQWAAGAGPAVIAAIEGTASNVALADAAGRWPDLAASAAAEGVGGILAVPIAPGDAQLRAGLVVYGREPGCFSAMDEHVATLAARHAAVLAKVLRGHRELSEALSTRDLIGQAKGILMVRESCTAEHAFDILRRASQRTNRKLRDVAADLANGTQRQGRPRR